VSETQVESPVAPRFETVVGAVPTQVPSPIVLVAPTPTTAPISDESSVPAYETGRGLAVAVSTAAVIAALMLALLPFLARSGDGPGAVSGGTAPGATTPVGTTTHPRLGPVTRGGAAAQPSSSEAAITTSHPRLGPVRRHTAVHPTASTTRP
jgi:hypothetical protein